MTDIDTIAAEIEIGEQARQFLKSDLGRCVMGMAEQEIDALRDKLESVEGGSLIRVQSEIRAMRMFSSWLVELINKGEQQLTVWAESKGES